MPKFTVDYSDVVAIDADGNRFHKKCARKRYGFQAIEDAVSLSAEYSEYEVVRGQSRKMCEIYDVWPKDHEENLIHVIRTEEWEEIKAQAEAHGGRRMRFVRVLLGND